MEIKQSNGKKLCVICGNPRGRHLYCCQECEDAAKEKIKDEAYCIRIALSDELDIWIHELLLFKGVA